MPGPSASMRGTPFFQAAKPGWADSCATIAAAHRAGSAEPWTGAAADGAAAMTARKESRRTSSSVLPAADRLAFRIVSPLVVGLIGLVRSLYRSRAADGGGCCPAARRERLLFLSQGG
ncbi:hypothetical protein [Cohnella rhizosphaerae]